jgi:hypothetical protein
MTTQAENTQGKTENTMTNQDQNTQEITKDNDGYDQHASHAQLNVDFLLPKLYCTLGDEEERA